MIAQELEVSLHMAFVEARQQRHEFITVEHLLLALLDNPSAAEVLRACVANVDELRKSLTGFIKENTPTVGGAGVRPTGTTTARWMWSRPSSTTAKEEKCADRLTETTTARSGATCSSRLHNGTSRQAMHQPATRSQPRLPESQNISRTSIC